MVSKMTYTLTGAKELEKTLLEMGPAVATKIADKALRAAAKIIIKEAKILAPRRTGALRKSIAAKVGQLKPAERTVTIGFKKPGRSYAHMVEFGTSHSAAKPFLRPALDAKASEALREMTEVLADGILRQEWRRALQTLSEGKELDFGDLD